MDNGKQAPISLLKRIACFFMRFLIKKGLATYFRFFFVFLIIRWISVLKMESGRRAGHSGNFITVIFHGIKREIDGKGLIVV